MNLIDKKKRTTIPQLKSFDFTDIDVAILDKAINLFNSPKDESGLIGRWQDRVILDEIPKNSLVLDLGCGDGELLATLIKTLNVRGQGVELDPLAVVRSIERGVPVLNFDLDDGLADFADHSFDYVILESTLQALKNPVAVLAEMLRVGQKGIVSFPNFGHWRVRFDLAVRGRMPMTQGLPYQWYDTPNIHLFTLADFLDWCAESGAKPTQIYGLVDGVVQKISETDNLTAEEVLVFLEQGGQKPLG
ncbi:MAG: methionine biosynthesis protein MetW [Candidatus Adiutrix sp.]